MSKTESVLFKLGADVSGLTRGLAQGRDGLKEVEKSASSLTGKLVGLAGVLGVGLGFAEAAHEALEFADTVMKVSDQTSLSTDAVQRLAFFASQTGNQLSDVTTALGKMQQNMVKAAEGTTAQKEAFENLNLDMDAFFQMDPEAQFQAVAVAIDGISDPAHRTAAAVSVFGKSGAEVIPLMRAMAQEGTKLNAQFDALGGPMSATTIKALDDIGDGAKTAGTTIRNFAGELIALAAPAVLSALEGITTFFAALRFQVAGGANEMVNLDDEITTLTQTIQDAKAGLTLFGPQNTADLKVMEDRLAALKAQYKALEEAPMKLAAAQNAAKKAAALNGPENLDDIIVHADVKRKTVLDKDLQELQERYTQQQEWEKIIQADIADHEAAISEIQAVEMDARAQFYLQSMDQQVATVAGKLIEMTAATAQHSRAMFAINKIASIAKATMDGYESVQSSYKFGSAIGGPPVGAAFAAVAAAATAANVAAIARTQFNGGGAGVAPSNATQAPVPTTPAGGGSGGGQGGSVLRVEGLDGASLFTGKFVRGLAEKLAEHQKDGGTVIFA